MNLVKSWDSTIVGSIDRTKQKRGFCFPVEVLKREEQGVEDSLGQFWHSVIQDRLIIYLMCFEIPYSVSNCKIVLYVR